jgi:hypothetical protein
MNERTNASHDGFSKLNCKCSGSPREMNHVCTIYPSFATLYICAYHYASNFSRPMVFIDLLLSLPWFEIARLVVMVMIRVSF